jgi:hypothetical protein
MQAVVVVERMQVVVLNQVMLAAQAVQVVVVTAEHLQHHLQPKVL